MSRGKPHNPEKKAAAMAALLAGQGVDQVAEDYEIPRSTVKAWRQKLKSENVLDEPEKSAELGELILGYLRENLTTLEAQARQFRDTEWLKGQTADDLAVLHGVLTDKAIRILAALEPNE